VRKKAEAEAKVEFEAEAEAEGLLTCHTFSDVSTGITAIIKSVSN